MGVPAFFRWLSRKYPSVIVDCVQQLQVEVNGEKVPVNIGEANPNGVEFDNLYLDMNGIIHPCTHPEDRPAPANEEQMMLAIFEAIDRMMAIVRPRKLLYMAIDGTAPRAKMNQQRSRRFRASKESSEKREAMAKIKAELRAKGVILPEEKGNQEHFDSNCITPGTPFMHRLSECLCFYVHERLNSEAGWRGVKVILSDANVPGEGEHKIMDFIRKQRASPGHDPNTQHVLCGADADLIMLGLATHEPNFTIIREQFQPNKPRPCDICGQLGHEMAECTGQMASAAPDQPPPVCAEQQYIFVRLCVLREYLRRELEMHNLPFEYDFERVVDDWVFMCFFVGNDFLPHLPSLEIRENAIDRLVGLYKNTVHRTGGFLTKDGRVNLERVQLIMHDLGGVEDEIFKNRQQREVRFRQRNRDQRRQKRLEQQHVTNGQFAPRPVDNPGAPVTNARLESYQMRMQQMANYGTDAGSKRSRDGDLGQESEDDEPPDEVRLWEDGFKERYYESKFDVDPNDVEFRHRVAREYVIGLCWVLRYYYQGCASWKWYFPYHYAPFASDFRDIASMRPQFQLAAPFKPLEQLMGVFPAASRSHVPEPWARLMTDPESPIIDFYPLDFQIDLNGKKYAWQGVALLPFVCERRLKQALQAVYDQLSEEEQRRNTKGHDRLFIHSSHPGSEIIGLVCGDDSRDRQQEVSLNPELFEGISGQTLPTAGQFRLGSTVYSPLSSLKPLPNNRVLMSSFCDPKFPVSHVFPARRLRGAVSPPRVLKPQDLDSLSGRNWRPQVGMARSNTVASLDRSGHRWMNRVVRSNSDLDQRGAPMRGGSWKRGYDGDAAAQGNPGPGSYRDGPDQYQRGRWSETGPTSGSYNHSPRRGRDSGRPPFHHGSHRGRDHGGPSFNHGPYGGREQNDPYGQMNIRGYVGYGGYRR